MAYLHRALDIFAFVNTFTNCGLVRKGMTPIFNRDGIFIVAFRSVFFIAKFAFAGTRIARVNLTLILGWSTLHTNAHISALACTLSIALIIT